MRLRNRNYAELVHKAIIAECSNEVLQTYKNEKKIKVEHEAQFNTKFNHKAKELKERTDDRNNDS